MRYKYLYFSIVLALFSSNLLAQDFQDYVKIDTNRVRNIINSGNFRIDILNAVQEGASPVAIYSTKYIKVEEGRVRAKFPYFYRDDNPSTATKSDINMNTKIHKIKIKENTKKGLFNISLLVLDKNNKKNKILIQVQYDGYSLIKMTDKKKRTVLYDGRLKI